MEKQIKTTEEKLEKYESKGVVTEFGGHSRASVKIKESFYTFESSVQKNFPAGTDLSKVDMEQEWKLLFEELNANVDDQIEETEKAYSKTK